MGKSSALKNAAEVSADNAPCPLSSYGFSLKRALYVWNAFFDIVVPKHSLPCIRLVAHLMGKVLKDGQLPDTAFEITYSEFVSAGVRRASIKNAIKEAENAHFIESVKTEKSKTLLKLRVVDAGSYSRNADLFKGFLVDFRERTPTPREYLTHFVKTEPLAAVRIMGVLLRETLGRSDSGVRRTKASLSYSVLQTRAGDVSRATVWRTVKKLSELGFIDEIQGNFREANVYRPRLTPGAEVKPLKSLRFQNETTPRPGSSNMKLPPMGQFRNETTAGSKTKPQPSQKQFQNETQYKYKYKQQQSVCDDGKKGLFSAFNALGVSTSVVKKLIRNFGEEAVRVQLEYFPYRPSAINPAGMIVKAIKESWDPPRQRSVAKSKARRLIRASGSSNNELSKLREQYLALKKSDPESYQAFKEYEAAVHEKLLSCISEENKKTLIQHLNRPEELLKRFSAWRDMLAESRPHLEH